MRISCSWSPMLSSLRGWCARHNKTKAGNKSYSSKIIRENGECYGVYSVVVVVVVISSSNTSQPVAVLQQCATCGSSSIDHKYVCNCLESLPQATLPVDSQTFLANKQFYVVDIIFVMYCIVVSGYINMAHRSPGIPNARPINI